ncbi:MAG: hypothetical protein QOD10_4596 [Mycobacterium sp.]|jgi:hypothetical protein|nr:hypothetical protein [Mycobacterium sp.]
MGPGFHAGWLLVLDVGLGMRGGGAWRGRPWPALDPAARVDRDIPGLHLSSRNLLIFVGGGGPGGGLVVDRAGFQAAGAGAVVQRA